MTRGQIAGIAILCAVAAFAEGGSPIQFEDVTEQSGIRFTHSFGAEKLGSLLESTGAGCVWLDYNKDGKPDLFVVSGRGVLRHEFGQAARQSLPEFGANHQ